MWDDLGTVDFQRNIFWIIRADKWEIWIYFKSLNQQCILLSWKFVSLAQMALVLLQSFTSSSFSTNLLDSCLYFMKFSSSICKWFELRVTLLVLQFSKQFRDSILLCFLMGKNSVKGNNYFKGIMRTFAHQRLNLKSNLIIDTNMMQRSFKKDRKHKIALNNRKGSSVI